MVRLAAATIFIIILLLPRVDSRYAYAAVTLEYSVSYKGQAREKYRQSLTVPYNLAQDDGLMTD